MIHMKLKRKFFDNFLEIVLFFFHSKTLKKGNKYTFIIFITNGHYKQSLNTPKKCLKKTCQSACIVPQKLMN